MSDAAVSAQPEEMCGGGLQWTSTSSRRDNNISSSEATIALMVYAAVFAIAELGI